MHKKHLSLYFDFQRRQWEHLKKMQQSTISLLQSKGLLQHHGHHFLLDLTAILQQEFTNPSEAFG